MIIVGSQNAAVGMPAGWRILAAGGSAVDAVEAVVRAVEDNVDDHTVGLGGYPNLLGEVELDASIMDGNGRRAGAVAAVRGRRHAITIARAVMDRLPHVLLASEGAERLADAAGEPTERLLTPAAEQMWRTGLDQRLPDDFPDLREWEADTLVQAAALATDPEHAHGTVNVVAQDSNGGLASAVSTSGWAWKFPGRVGDSPIIGAGNYADSRYGAATCTGSGELAIRCHTAASIVSALRACITLEDACREALGDIASLPDVSGGAVMSLLAVDADGVPCAVSTVPDTTYVRQDTSMSQPESVLRRHVPL